MYIVYAFFYLQQNNAVMPSKDAEQEYSQQGCRRGLAAHLIPQAKVDEHCRS